MAHKQIGNPTTWNLLASFTFQVYRLKNHFRTMGKNALLEHNPNKLDRRPRVKAHDGTGTICESDHLECACFFLRFLFTLPFKGTSVTQAHAVGSNRIFKTLF